MTRRPGPPTVASTRKWISWWTGCTTWQENEHQKCPLGMPTLLTPEQRQQLQQERPAWEVDDSAMRRSIVFKDFVGLRFHEPRGPAGWIRQHHPDWCNVYNRVKIELSTHDLGGLSTLDLELSAAIDALLPA